MPFGVWIMKALVLVILSVWAYYIGIRTILEAVTLHHESVTSIGHHFCQS
jgi:hypothetical protein